MEEIEEAPMYVLGVICGPPRPELTPWQELIERAAVQYAPMLPGEVDKRLWSRLTWEFVDISDGGEALPPLEKACNRFCAVVFSGSKFNTTDDIPWLASSCQWIRDVVGPDGSPRIPMFGICFGHQLLAKALGGVVGFNPNGAELGTRKVDLLHQTGAGDALWERLFCGPTQRRNGDPSRVAAEALMISNGAEWLAQEVHWQSVLELPRGAVSFASSDMDANQWVCFGRGIYGTQFHPEYPRSYMSELGKHLPGLREEDSVARKAYYETLQESSAEGCAIISAFVDLAINRSFALAV